MSQAGIISTSTGPVPPIVATSYVTDVNSPAIPIANVLNVLGADTTSNNDNGIRTDGSSGSNTLTVQLTNRTTGTVNTSDATLTTIITFPLGATPGVYYFWGSIESFDSLTPAAGTYSFSAGIRTDGVSGTELGTEYHDTFEDPSFATTDIFISASGNNAVVQVQGLAATTIHWNSLLEFRVVT